MSAHGPRTVLFCCLVFAILSGCSQRLETPVPGTYRAVLSLPGGEAPFGMEIAQEQQRYVLYLTNGSERTRVDAVEVRDRELTASFPGYENTLRATMHRNGLEGAVTLIKAGGKEQVIPFKATLGDTWRFYSEPLTDNADVAGQWEMTFTSDDGKPTRTIALLEQQHDRVTGTVHDPDRRSPLSRRPGARRRPAVVHVRRRTRLSLQTAGQRRG